VEFWLIASSEDLRGVDEYWDLQGYKIVWTEKVTDVSEYLLPICRLWALRSSCTNQTLNVETESSSKLPAKIRQSIRRHTREYFNIQEFN
jgi:hypothetical protein